MTAPETPGPQYTGLAELRDRERHNRRVHFVPPPRLTVSEWADQHRVLSSESSAVTGQWRSFAFQRAIMDEARNPRTRRVVGMLPSQVGGKTEILLNLIGYHVDLDPCPILLVEPTLEMADAISKDRIWPMFRDTPRLSGMIVESGRRDPNNTLRHKAGPGWRLTLVGANSPSGLAMRPIRVVLLDEPDRYPISAGPEGDVVRLAEVRSTTFPNRVRYMTGTPTIKGASRIEREYELSSQGKWFVPCPHCGFMQSLEWGGPDEPFGLKWEAGDPDTAAYLCASCAALIPETAKDGMVARGEWRHQYPTRTVRGFHCTALVSPLVRWSELVREWLESKDDMEALKAFVNTRLARSWEEPGEAVEPSTLASRREAWGDVEVPAGVSVLTAAVDVQQDRLELLVMGWGAGEESWLVRHYRLRGDPAQDEVWRDLEHHLTRPWMGVDGELRIRATGVDTGHLTAVVYDWVRPRQRRGVYALKGASEYARPIITKAGKSDKYKIRVWPVGTDAAKDLMFSRLLRVHHPGPGYVHLHESIDQEFLDQLGSEYAVRVTRGGKSIRTWRLRPGRRNEAVDLLVYNVAALFVLGAGVRAHLTPRTPSTRPVETPEAPEGDPEAAPLTPEPYLNRVVKYRKARRSKGFVTRW